MSAYKFVLPLLALCSNALAAGPSLDLATVNDPALRDEVGRKASAAAVLRAQVLLERAHFSVGEIDAGYGSNTRKAILAWQTRMGLEATGRLDEASWAKLNEDVNPILASYTLTAQDVQGPFLKLPTDMMDKAKLEALGFESAAEALGEKFHASPKLLARLNPGKDLSLSGEVLIVPIVEPTQALAKAAKVVVDRSDSALTVLDADGVVMGYFPASTGSEHDPLPVGEWSIKGVAPNPEFFYSPELFWDADPTHAKAKIAPGPNNPVGVAWIDLSKEHYGIHGTPAPSRVGKTESHGCIRLTNWSAAALALVVGPGTPAILQE